MTRLPRAAEQERQLSIKTVSSFALFHNNLMRLYSARLRNYQIQITTQCGENPGDYLGLTQMNGLMKRLHLALGERAVLYA